MDQQLKFELDEILISKFCNFKYLHYDNEQIFKGNLCLNIDMKETQIICDFTFLILLIWGNPAINEHQCEQ